MIEKKHNIPINRYLIVSLLFIVTYIFILFMSYGKDVLPLKPFNSFPKMIGEWKGEEHYFEQNIYNILGVDDSILMFYENSNIGSIQLYVGYYHSQREGELIHSPKHCLPGSGQHITNTHIEKITVSGKEIKVIKLTIEKGIQKQIVYYWYQSRGRFVSSEYWDRIFLVWDAITKNRTDGSLVRIIAPVDERGEEYTSTYMENFIKKLIPVLNEYIPGS